MLKQTFSLKPTAELASRLTALTSGPAALLATSVSVGNKPHCSRGSYETHHKCLMKVAYCHESRLSTGAFCHFHQTQVVFFINSSITQLSVVS